MNYSFHPEAEVEFEDAVRFYDAADVGLGDAFEQEVFLTISRIIRYPNSWPKYTYRSRRCLCNRFPYSIIYRFTDDEVTIYAVMHQSRKPGYWKDRF